MRVNVEDDVVQGRRYDQHGHVVAVEDILAASTLLTDVLVGATSLVVADTLPFEEKGGQLKLRSSGNAKEIVKYIAVDDETSTLTLDPTTPTTLAWSLEDDVLVYPESHERIAHVELEDSPDEVILAFVPRYLRKQLPAGIRGEDDQESVALRKAPSDDDWHVADIIGGLDIADEQIVFTVSGTTAVTAFAHRWYATAGDYHIVTVRTSVGVAPTGSGIVVDVNKNGNTIFTDQTRRPEIAIGTFTAISGEPNRFRLSEGDYITIDIDQVGSTVAGQDLVVQVILRRN